MSEVYFAIGCSVAALILAGCLVASLRRKDPGNEKMVKISRLVQEGARAFLRREFGYVAVVVVIVAVLISVAPALKPGIQLGWKTAMAFLAGALLSWCAGYIGMSIATRANAPTTQAANVEGLRGALSVALSGGAVMGMSVVGLALLGLCVVYLVFRGEPAIVNGYAMGASLVALFARSGGGIFTKGADMGADLVGKVEAGIPEDDPRNPAVIADNVGDNVGDVAGLGADLLESYVEAIIASMVIASVIGAVTLTTLPFLIAGAGIIASIVGVLYVKFLGGQKPQSALMMGTYISAGLTIVATWFIVKRVAPADMIALGDYQPVGVFWASVLGVLCGVAIGLTSEFFTSSKYRPVRNLAASSETGPAVTVTDGMAVGMQSTAIPVLILAIAVVLSYKFCGIYGVAIASLGMLATTGMIVSVDSYGPIADNAGGIAEMAQLDPKVRAITDNLDAVGNTTAAIGKGFAIGSAAFAALGLLAAFMQSAGVTVVNIADPKVMAGVLVGGMLPFLFSSMLFRAVGKVAFQMIAEVRRQFKEIAGLMEGTAEPDSARCVDISAAGAIRGMLVPGVMVILIPVLGGLILGPAGLAGLLIGALATGVMLGIQFANSGGALDNAKKYIEEGNLGGKGSPAHAAAVVGDTVGDPLKDTVGPSINILIKLMCVISLVLAPLFLAN
jgi:K(+)-stimulated pyrophosphate-energized sodium pump